MTVNLLTPVLSDVRHVNFFEQRLLTGRDLSDEQVAVETHLRQLGRAVGDGVVQGFDVSIVADGSPGTNGGGPAIAVSPGLAINREGQTLTLENNETIALSRTHDRDRPAADLFDNCEEPGSDAIDPVAVGSGAYVLIAAPVNEYRERAPKGGLGDGGRISGCGDRYVVEGIQFRLERLDLSIGPTDNLPQRSRVRNRVAQACLGTPQAAALSTDPFAAASTGQFAERGALAALRSATRESTGQPRLSNCDVPLAVLLWTFGGIQFVDLWSARRHPAQQPHAEDWPALVEPRRTAEAQAALMQFDEHIGWLLRESTNPQAIAATDHFDYLPPAGLLPLDGPDNIGFQIDAFFSGLLHSEPGTIDRNQVRGLLRESLDYDPIELAQGDFIWVLRCRQNVEAGGSPAPRHFALFASPFVPAVELSRFDATRLDAGRFLPSP